MKNGLRYLFPLLFVAIALFCGRGECVQLHSPTGTVVVDSDDDAQFLESLESFASESDLQLPCHISGVGTTRLQTAVKRTYNTHRNNLEFFKAGKVIYAGFESHVYKESLNIGYLFVEPCHRLIRLGRLVI